MCRGWIFFSKSVSVTSRLLLRCEMDPEHESRIILYDPESGAKLRPRTSKGITDLLLPRASPCLY